MFGTLTNKYRKLLINISFNLYYTFEQSIYKLILQHLGFRDAYASLSWDGFPENCQNFESRKCLARSTYWSL